jgi:hypothetical protein
LGSNFQTGTAGSKIRGNPKLHHQIPKESAAHCHNGKKGLPKTAGEVFKAKTTENKDSEGFSEDTYEREFLEVTMGSKSMPFEKQGDSVQASGVQQGINRPKFNLG